MFLVKIAEVMGMEFTRIFNTKVIYDETESYGVAFVAPEARHG